MVVWDLNGIYDFKKNSQLLDELKQKVGEFKSFRNELSESLAESKFFEILKKRESISIIASKLSAYSDLWLSENTSDSIRTSHEAMISQACIDAENEIMFFTLWFKSLNNADKFINAAGKYSYFLKRIRAFKDFTLQEKEEQIINLKDLSGACALTKLYDTIANKFEFELDGKKLNQEQINQFKYSPDRDKRVASYQKVLSRYGEEENVLGEIYKNIVNDWRNENVKIRGYSSPITVRNMGNDLPSEAVDALLKVARKNANLFQDYFKLKAALIGLNEFDRFDLYSPYSSSEKEYPYDESKKMSLETYRQFDEKAYEMAKKIFDDNCVHSEIAKSKRSGAFCYSITNTLPPYILLNHIGKLNDLFTMMHEFGHGIHSLAAKDQTHFTFHSTLPLAETASIFGEMLLSQRLLNESEKKEKISVLVKMLDGQYGSIMRQAFFVIFELEAHNAIEKGATIEELNGLYLNLLHEQFGKMKVDQVFQHEWKYIPHIFHSPFYCYSYSFGNLLVLALFRMYEKQGKDFVPKYLKILSYGGSKSTMEILEEVGIDITKEEFWQGGFDIIKDEIKVLENLTK